MMPKLRSGPWLAPVISGLRTGRYILSDRDYFFRAKRGTSYLRRDYLLLLILFANALLFSTADAQVSIRLNANISPYQIQSLDSLTNIAPIPYDPADLMLWTNKGAFPYYLRGERIDIYFRSRGGYFLTLLNITSKGQSNFLVLNEYYGQYIADLGLPLSVSGIIGGIPGRSEWLVLIASYAPIMPENQVRIAQTPWNIEGIDPYLSTRVTRFNVLYDYPHYFNYYYPRILLEDRVYPYTIPYFNSYFGLPRVGGVQQPRYVPLRAPVRYYFEVSPGGMPLYTFPGLHYDCPIGADLFRPLQTDVFGNPIDLTNTGCLAISSDQTVTAVFYEQYPDSRSYLHLVGAGELINGINYTRLNVLVNGVPVISDYLPPFQTLRLDNPEYIPIGNFLRVGANRIEFRLSRGSSGRYFLRRLEILY